jgi:predicted Zn finger-like uncharacterized protein
MRLICPSCRAQYEVDDDAIPAEGRDVQCGACNTTWFQEHALTLTGAMQAPVAASTKPVFKHHGATAGTGIPAPQPMPDDSPADRDKLLREIREEAEQQISFEAKSRIEREPLPSLEPETETASLSFENEGGATEPVVDEDLPRETKLDTTDVHAYQEDEPVAEPTAQLPESGQVEEAFMQNLRSQIEEQNSQPENFATARSSSVMSAAEKAGISLDPAKVTPPTETSRSTSLQNTLRDLGSTPEPEPRRRSYSVGVYLAAVLFLLAFAAYLLRGEITKFYPAAGPSLDAYAAGVDSGRLVVQDLWNYARNWVTSMIG